MQEKLLENYPIPITVNQTEIILEQMKKNVCRIYLNNGKKGTGFFCLIPFPHENNLLPVLITNNHILDESYLNQENHLTISLYKDNFGNEIIKKIDISNKKRKYTSQEHDITIIEINENKEGIDSFLYLDPKLMIENGKDTYTRNTIYAIGYPQSDEIKVKVSYGNLLNKLEDKEYEFNHSCSTKEGSSGSPILNLETNKVIGIHKQSSNKNYNKGSFLDLSIKNFISKNYNNINNNNIINNNSNENININNIDFEEYLEKANEEDDFYFCERHPILIENHSSKCRGGFFIQELDKFIKTKNYPIKHYLKNNNNYDDYDDYNYDELEYVWGEVFNELNIGPYNKKIILSEPLMNTKRI